MKRRSTPEKQRRPVGNLLRRAVQWWAEVKTHHAVAQNKSPLWTHGKVFICVCVWTPSLPGAQATPMAVVGETPPKFSVATSGRCARFRYPTGKINWGPTAAHRVHREWVTLWQHYHQGAETPTPLEVRGHWTKSCTCCITTDCQFWGPFEMRTL
jgi:hypothetical protein